MQNIEVDHYHTTVDVNHEMTCVLTMEQTNAMLASVVIKICPLHLAHTYKIVDESGEEQTKWLKKEQGVAARAEITLHNPKKPIENSYIFRN